MTHVHAHKVGPFWRVTVTTLTPEGVYDERTATARRFGTLMRQLGGTS